MPLSIPPLFACAGEEEKSSSLFIIMFAQHPMFTVENCIIFAPQQILYVICTYIFVWFPSRAWDDPHERREQMNDEWTNGCSIPCLCIQFVGAINEFCLNIECFWYSKRVDRTFGHSTVEKELLIRLCYSMVLRHSVRYFRIFNWILNQNEINTAADIVCGRQS